MTQTVEIDDTTAGTAEYTFLSSRLPEAAAAIEKANRRLARAGATDRFTYTCQDDIREVTVGDGPTQRVEHHAVTTLILTRPIIGVGDWEFLATLIHEAGGAVITRGVRGRTIGELIDTAAGRCDHCGTTRVRRDTYLIRNRTTGQMMQMGKSCLQPFLGMRPSGLWALDFELSDRITSAGGGATRGDLRVPVRDILATALAVADHGRAYVSRAEAQLNERLTSTASQVKTALFARPTAKDRELAAWQRDIAEQTKQILAEGEEIDAVLSTAAGLDTDSDYGRNVRTLVSLDWVDVRNIGLIASLIKVHHTERTRRTVQPWAAGHLGQPGEKLVNVPAQLTTVRTVEGYYGYSTLVIAQTDDGHAIKWITTSDTRDLAPFQRVIITARVKSHQSYRGVDQTVVIRAKLVPVSPSDPAATDDSLDASQERDQLASTGEA